MQVKDHCLDPGLYISALEHDEVNVMNNVIKQICSSSIHKCNMLIIGTPQ